MRSKLRQVPGNPAALANMQLTLQQMQLSVNLSLQQTQQMLSQFQILEARLFNAAATIDTSEVTPVPNLQGALPPDLPATRGEIQRLRGPDLDGHLAHYGLPVQGSLRVRLRRLQRALSIPQPSLY